MEVGGRATKKGDSPLGEEGGLMADVRISRSLLLDKPWQRQLHVQTSSREQRVPYYCWRTKWEMGSDGKNWAGEGGSDWIRKGLEGSLAVVLVGNRKPLQV